jgi:hypothetical protein
LFVHQFYQTPAEASVWIDVLTGEYAAGAAADARRDFYFFACIRGETFRLAP